MFMVLYLGTLYSLFHGENSLTTSGFLKGPCAAGCWRCKQRNVMCLFECACHEQKYPFLRAIYLFLNF